MASILPDTQLLVNYKLKTDNINHVEDLFIQTVDECTKKSLYRCLGIINNGTNCYINVALQMIRKKISTFIIDG